MTKVTVDNNLNCIATPAQCVEWTYGSIPFLGICNEDRLPKIIWEIVNKLQEFAGEDLSTFDLDTILTICNQKAPLEKNLISILEIMRNNQVCLKDYIDTLNETLNELSKTQALNINLKCLADFDNFGNQLSITRETFDQLVIDKLCNHETRITTVEGKVVVLQNQIDNINVNPVVAEPNFTTCVDPVSKPTSQQAISIANKVCEIEEYLGDEDDASIARGNFNFEDSRYFPLFGPTWLITASRENILDDYNNLLLVVKDLEARVIDIQSNCCAPTCDKIAIGFSVVAGDDEGDFFIRFRPTDGNNLFGFTDNGSKVTFTGKELVTGQDFTTLIPYNIDVTDEDGESNVYALGQWFRLNHPITISLTVKVTNGSLVCEKCISRTIDLANNGCPVCEIEVGGTKGGSGVVTITYQY